MCTNKASLYPSSSLSTGHIHAWHLDLLVAADAKLGPAAAGVCEVIIHAAQGFAFVAFVNKAAAEKAIEAKNIIIKGKRVIVV